MTRIALSLVSHTNVGKTALARTLLARDIGEVRDAPHVTEFADEHPLLQSPAGDTLLLWDTPGFGDSARLARRMRLSGNPLGWFLSEVWDRWRDRPFWASQQALRNLRDQADVVLYLVNAAEPPGAAGYLAPEMELLQWVGKPVLVLLNQLGSPRDAPADAAECDAWREQLARWPLVRAVLPMDAFARCWVQEGVLWSAVGRVLGGEAAAAMQRLHAAWAAQRRAVFDASVQALAASLARLAALHVPVDEGGLGDTLRQLGAAVGLAKGGRAGEAAERALAAALDEEVRAGTAALIALHGLDGRAQGAILERVAAPPELRRRVGEGRAALLGSVVSGALTGLKADVASGGLTLGGGMIAGGLIGALSAAGLARGFNVMRGVDRSWAGLGPEAMEAAVRGALLRYLAVAHHGRGRGEWGAEGDGVATLPGHWVAAVDEVLEAHRADLAALWARRSTRFDNAGEAQALAAALQPLLADCAGAALARLYPSAWPPGSDNPPA